jgi:predicted nucleotidyltransferase component of viral defense system
VFGFGELRKLSVQWTLDITAVEHRYCIDWVIKGVFDHAAFSDALVLRGSAALQYAHCPDYPLGEEPEFLATQPLDKAVLRAALTDALGAAANTSGLKFSLAGSTRTSAKVEYTGPLGRRSAAQPHIALSFVPGQTRRPPARVPLVHPFSDECVASVSAIALEEFVAERIAQLGQTPRARDVFDLWFVLTNVRERIDLKQTKDLAQEIARAKNCALPRADAPFDPAYRAGLERSWDNALRRVPRHPPFAQLEKDLIHGLEGLDHAG